MRRLIASGAKIDWRDEDGWTALMQAAAGTGSVEVMRDLVEAGAKIDVWGQGDTPIVLAATAGHRQAYEYLAPHVSDKTRRKAEKALEESRSHPKIAEDLVSAAIHGDLESVRALIAAGAPIDYRNRSPGSTALMYAALYGRTDVIEVLLDAGADVDARVEASGAERGWTALTYAASSYFARNRAEILRQLVEGGADVHARDEKGRTALHVALDRGPGHPDSVAALLELGADPMIEDEDGRSLVSMVLENRNRAVDQATQDQVELLLNSLRKHGFLEG